MSFESNFQGKIAYYLTKNRKVEVLKNGLTPTELTIQLLQLGDFSNLRVILDAGALFMGVVMPSLAQFILGSRKDLEAVVYFEKDQTWILKRDLESPLPFHGNDIDPSKRFTIYDQARCKGTNISQMPNAHVLITVRKEQDWNDVAQTAFRMRNLEQGQSLTIVITEEFQELVSKKISKVAPLNSKDVVKYLVKSLVEKQSKEALKTIKQKIHRIFERARLNILEIVKQEPQEQ